jgi:hypothetical protein
MVPISRYQWGASPPKWAKMINLVGHDIGIYFPVRQQSGKQIGDRDGLSASKIGPRGPLSLPLSSVIFRPPVQRQNRFFLSFAPLIRR